MAAKVGNVHNLKDTSLKYKIYYISGQNKAVPNTERIVYLVLTGKLPIFALNAQRFISVPEDFLLDYFSTSL